MSSQIPTLGTTWTARDFWHAFRCRTSSFRMRFRTAPGLYAIGAPGADSEIFVTANYTLSVNHLRRALRGRNGWVLVLDTGGINVWCAAGKGKFGTYELMKRIRLHQLEQVVSHRRLIVPQLGAPGIQAHRVKDETGFRVHYGPVRAEDLPRYLDNDLKANPTERTVEFGLLDRLILIPMEIVPVMGKVLIGIAAFLALFCFPDGTRNLESQGLPLAGLLLASAFAGSCLTPLLLPWVPFRSFAAKGWIVGMLVTIAAIIPLQPSPALAAFAIVFFPVVSSYLALLFTGSTTFTNPSGVKKEIDLSFPIYRVVCGLSVILLIVLKAVSWRAP